MNRGLSRRPHPKRVRSPSTGQPTNGYGARSGPERFAEALRVLAERYGIRAEEVVAVGDADNDIPMLAGAGLGVAMQNSMPSTRAVARRVIGDNNGDAIARLIEELWG